MAGNRPTHYNSRIRSELTPRQREILELIGRGYTNGQLAEALGLSLDGAKYHVSEILQKLGVNSREEAAEYWQQSRGVWSRLGQLPGLAFIVGSSKALLIGAASVLAVGAVAALVLVRAGDSHPAGVTPALVTDRAATPPVPPTVIEGSEALYALGKLLDVPSSPGSPVKDISERESMTVVTLSGPGSLVYSAGLADWTPVFGSPPGPNLFELQAGVGGVRVSLNIYRGNDQTTFQYGAADSVGIASSDGSLPQVIIMASRTTPHGDFQRRHSSVDSKGNLFISVDPIPDSVALNVQTGEALDTSNTTRVGPVAAPDPPGKTEITICDARACHVQAYGAIFAPIDGELTCTNGVLDLRSANLTIEFAMLTANGTPQPCASSSIPATVANGETMLTADTVSITGRSAAGALMGAAVAGDDSLYIGEIDPKFGCPCLSGIGG